ncbi:DNA repair exonuclease [Evansella sp. LMS18]|uniref:metallophosphoesterase family protein n=1 Tax=Evansella sp. LMS18 TaxID=2924033 RepID=UPI0020D026D4|nr:DNA repair exonuclease [Evansella sp. LMS18]UTR09221.1 DNA repair exonuclease [Evansella sp. LMS18]
MLRFIHTADVHLGRPVKSRLDMPEKFAETAREAAYVSFQRIIDESLSRQADFVLISGDVYDQEERSLRGQWFIKKQAERLQEAGIPLLITHGNHDPLNNKNGMVAMPDNVHIFPSVPEPYFIEKNNGEKAYIYGFSYPQKAFYENPVPLFKKENDLEAYHIGMLHGQETQQDGHEPYAPFAVRDLLQLGFDYWALGHIHKRQTLNMYPPVVYPGNVQGGTRKETGAKGAYFVELEKHQTNLHFVETSPLQWEKIEVHIDGHETMDELIAAIIDNITASILKEKLYFTALKLTGNGTLHEELTGSASQQELLELLREELIPYSVWVDRISFQTAPYIDREKLKKQNDLLGDIIDTSEKLRASDKELDKTLKPVFSHPVMKRYIDRLTPEDREEIITEAESRLISSLMEEVDR